MALSTIKPDGLLRFTLCCLAINALATPAFILGSHVSSIRGPSFSVGIMAALIGVGVAGWFSIRARDWRLVVTALLSLLPLAFWSWVVYGIMHG